MRVLSPLLAMLLPMILAVGQETSAKHSLDELRFLIGEWEGFGAGTPGPGKGGFSFTLDLQDNVIVRKNYADYPSTAGRPAFRHDDLMIIYFDRASNQIRANYFDSENQQIRYKVMPASDHGSVTFLSEPSGLQPHYRLSYARVNDRTLKGKFEVAPREQPDAFKTYLEWSATKK